MNVQLQNSASIQPRTSSPQFGEHGKIIISFRKRKNTFSQPKYILSVKMHEKVAKLMVELSKSQDDEIGDGTTGVVVSSELSADSQLGSEDCFS